MDALRVIYRAAGKLGSSPTASHHRLGLEEALQRVARPERPSEPRRARQPRALYLDTLPATWLAADKRLPMSDKLVEAYRDYAAEPGTAGTGRSPFRVARRR